MTRTLLAGLTSAALAGLTLAQPPAAPPADPKSAGKDDPTYDSGSWRGPPTGTLYARQPPDTARIEVRVPTEAAEIWVEGKPTTTTGLLREYQSPRLPPDRRFVYTIKARWTEDRRPVEESVDVHFSAGDRVRVAFPVPKTPKDKPVEKAAKDKEV